MAIKLESSCQPAACRAAFTVDGQRGNQKYLEAGTVTLQADNVEADAFLWEVTSSPPACDYLLTGATLPTARLLMPGSGAYVVRLTVQVGECIAQERVILWVATPRRLYRIPADSEALWFDGDKEWAGDLARVVQQVDWSLPTPEQKAALDAARRPCADNPFATLLDVGGEQLPSVLTEEEIAAIKQAQEPGADNPFVTQCALPVHADELTPEQKAALGAAQQPGVSNPFVTQSALPAHADELTPEQKAALGAAQEPGAGNPFVTQSALPAHVDELTPEQKAALAAAANPGADNPFATCNDLLGAGDGLTEAQKAAIQAASEPGADNPFVTWSALPPQVDELTPNQKSALAAALEPGEDNPFITRSALPIDPLTETLLAALLAAQEPGPANPFVTASALPVVWPPQLTPDQEAAVDAADSPGAGNPFITQSALPPHVDELTEAQKAAIQAAQEPGGDNPFITQSALPPHVDELTEAQKAAIQAAQEPGAGNPFITLSALPPHVDELTEAQNAAIAAASDPSGDNPFVTWNALPPHPDELTEAQKAAIQAAQEPGARNPFITLSVLPPHSDELTEAQIAAIVAASDPSADNPFATRADVAAGDGLTEAQKAAIQAAKEPGSDNPFVTQSALPAIPPAQLTADELAAIIAAADPGADNPFVTVSALPPHSDELTVAQIAAIVAASDPSADNPFATRADVAAAGDGLTEAQKAAVAAANDPSGDNPFATQAELAAMDGLTEAEKSAIHAAHEPGADNAFVTWSALPPHADELTVAQKAGLDAAHEPGAENAFATRSELPPRLPAGQQDALDGAHEPSAENPFATLTDLVQSERGSRVVAAGFIDLSLLTAQTSMGKLRVVANDRNRGLATLSFAGYRPARRHRYVVNALACHQPAAARPQDVAVVSLVGFDDRGFTLQMARPAVGSFALGRCMVQVTEVAVEVEDEEPPATIEQAIRRYYTLIQKEDLQAAWLMLSGTFRRERNLTFERYVAGWKSSGPAIVIALHRCTVTDTQASLGIDLNYPSEGRDVVRRFRFDFVRSQSEGHPQFGHWLFVDGETVAPYGPFQLIWSRLSPNERASLGAIDPCAFRLSARFSFQSYEHGLMFWFEQERSAGNVWVLYEPDGDYLQGRRWQRYVDDWQGEEGPLCDEARALGPMAPARGFGDVWCNNAEVRQTLGVPLEGEAGSGDIPPFSQAVFFSGGVLFFKPKREGRLNATDEGIVLINNGKWRRLLLSQ